MEGDCPQPCTPRQVDVDASILDINTMYDREKLLEFIHGLAVAFDEAPTTGATTIMA